MKKGFIILAAVAGYSFFEVVLLLATGLGHDDPIPRFRAVLLFAHFLTIPGMAVVLSLILYGCHQWKRRVTLYFATVPGFLIVMLVPAIPVVLLEWHYSHGGADDPTHSVLVRSADYWYPVIVLTLGSILAFFLTKKARRHGVALETSRWLAERQTGIGPSDRKWRIRSIHIALWIPAAMVLLVFLFLPETWGVLTHIQQPRASRVATYHVPIPVTWIVIYNYSFQDDAEVSGFAGRGMGLDARPYIRGRFPLSYWGLRTTPYRWDRQKYNVVGRREFVVASTTLSCVEYSPPNKEIPKYETARYGAPLADIQCSSPDQLYASFVGESFHVSTFYKMVSGITGSK